MKANKKSLYHFLGVMLLLAVFFGLNFSFRQQAGSFLQKPINAKEIVSQNADSPYFNPKTDNASNAVSAKPAETFLDLVTRHEGLVPVLMYHHVGSLPANADQIRKDLTVSVSDFNRQISLLATLGFHTITTVQLYDALANNAQLPLKPVLITFDDGYADVFQNAVPILLEHHMIGTFAVVPGFFGQGDYTDWNTLANVQALGMEIICHSEHHMDFTNPIYNHIDKLSEIIDCKDDLQKHLGITTQAFVYPYGHYDSDTEQILKDNGFVIAFTTKFGITSTGQNLLELPRVRIHGSQLLSAYQQNLNTD